MLAACKKNMTAILLPSPLLRLNLEKNTLETFARLSKILYECKSSFLRIKCLRKSLDNEILPDFLYFRVPDNSGFWIKRCIAFN